MSEDIENFMIPRHLDAPPMMLWIEADTACIGASGFYVSVMFGDPLHMLFATLFTILIARYYARIKQSGGRGLIPQMAYWYMPGDKKKHPISPLIREYRG